MYIVREDASQYFGTMWIKWRLKCVVQQEKHSNVSCEHVISPSKEQQLLLRDDGIWTFFKRHCDSDLKFSEECSRENTRWKENRNVIIDRRTDVQDRSSTNYIIIYGNPNILFTTISKCRDVEKVEHIQWQWIVWSTCFVFLRNSPWRRANYAKCSFYLFQALVFHSMCYVPFAMHAFYWYETFYTSRIIILFRKIKCICLMALATKSWKFGYFNAFRGTSKANRLL